MADQRDAHALNLARTLGAVQEARRLGHSNIGSEHVLMASFADPIVRRALIGVGCDSRDVHRLVMLESSKRNGTDVEMLAEETGDVVLAPDAADLLRRALVDVSRIYSEPRPDPAQFSQALGAIMIAVLHDDQHTAATRILDEFGVRQHIAGITAAIRDRGEPRQSPPAT